MGKCFWATLYLVPIVEKTLDFFPKKIFSDFFVVAESPLRCGFFYLRKWEPDSEAVTKITNHENHLARSPKNHNKAGNDIRKPRNDVG